MGKKHGKISNEVKRLKGVQKIGISLMLIFLCLGCSGRASFNLKNDEDAGTNNFPEVSEYSVKGPPILHLGSKFIYKHTNLLDGQSSQVTMEVTEEKEFDHKKAYWIDTTGKGMSYFNIYDMNLNWVGLFGDGKELESAEPCLQVFKWPLRVGGKWNSKYTFRDFSDHSRNVYVHTSKVDVNIRTYEEVKVPAGSFKALRIQAGGETFWYAPSIGWIVKEQGGSQRDNRWILELVEYDIPKNT